MSRRSCVSLLPSALLACALMACTTPRVEKTESLTVQVDTLGDTIDVRIQGGSVWRDTARLVAEVAIGEADGLDEYLLGKVTSLAVAPSGELYLVDGQVPALRKYAADGRYLMTLGREGSGPGEYRRPDGGLAVLSDGRVVLRDPGNGRFAVYAPDGTPLEFWTGLRSGINTSNPLVRGPDDAVYTMVLLGTDLPPEQWTFGMARFDATGHPGDTVAIPGHTFEKPMIRAQRGESSTSNGVPFSADHHWAMLPSGVVLTGVSTEYRFTIHEAMMPRRISRNRWNPVPVLPEEREERERAVTENMRADYPGWKWNGPPIPATKPAYADLIGAQDGRIWVKVPTMGIPDSAAAELRYRESVAFDVYEADGRFLGHVLAPDGFRTSPQPVFLRDTVWAVTEDPDTGVPQVVRYRIQHED